MIRNYTFSVLAFAISISWLLGIVPAAKSASSPIGYTATLLPLPEGYVWSDAYGGTPSQQVGRGGGPATEGVSHAILWDGEASNLVDLHPHGYDYSFGGNVYGGNQVGWVGGPSSEYAALWHGTADSFVDLNPTGFSSSAAYGVSETHQVGWGVPEGTRSNHALMWNGTAASFLDLNPKYSSWSRAYEVSGDSQVGVVGQHAALWYGTAESYVNLNPAGFGRSFARSVEGDSQVGSGSFILSSHTRALLWYGSATDYVDLHPPGFASSSAQDVYGNTQVGIGRESYSLPARALLWHGSAESYVNLHEYVHKLDPGFVGSHALAIDASGNVYGSAWGDEIGRLAIKWTPIPEPGSQTMLMCSAFALLSRRPYKPRSETPHAPSC